MNIIRDITVTNMLAKRTYNVSCGYISNHQVLFVAPHAKIDGNRKLNRKYSNLALSNSFKHIGVKRSEQQ